MPTLHFVTHPDVVVDPDTPVPDWSLSPRGRRRLALALERGWLDPLGAVFSSAERKATEAARLVADRFGIAPVARPELGENDRSATGYLPGPEFEATADRFFAEPEQSVRGWERAVDAQRRIVAAVDRVLATAPPDMDVAVVAHGAVGALLLCHLLHVPIDRAHDQPGVGGGCVFTVDRRTRRVRAGWRAIDDLP